MSDESAVKDETEVIQQGRLAPEARRAVVELMRQGVVMADSRRLVFDALCRYQEDIRNHLADMYLRMQIDEPAGLALLLQGMPEAESDADEGAEDSPALISRRLLTLYDTLILLVLRRHYLDRETAGDSRITIELDQVAERLIPFLPLTASQSQDRKRLNGSIEQMKKRRILAAVRGEADRFEITPVIRYVVSAEMLEQLLVEYRRMADEAGPQASEPAGE
nr:DUF4194 domain-containing protein [Oceanococcus sp. HetDA_MAG_MS8]